VADEAPAEANAVPCGVSAGPGRRTGLKTTGRYPGVPSGSRDLLALSEPYRAEADKSN